ncbi:N-acetyltransferase [Marinomonas sp. C2222]|uniref:N-acetyltransferase n=1 Tax=Marinomonas sargassi TaxID=2984494 RepID=A0ABT2YU67_9GAMM|nr:N-acetyltransferase [Marinomonas sargassi]MCV2403431.1 N-acetyltransferase [Marinomonas sargassi]
MRNIEYLAFEYVDLNVLMDVLNEGSLREHLVEHPYFDPKSISEWVKGKVETDAVEGCRVRVISIDGDIAGWCGIQPDDKGFEIAIVLSQKFWGAGASIFKTLLGWAAELGHKEVCFHLLDSRREYKTLAKMADSVSRSQLLGRSFTTYLFSVDQKNP